MKVPNAVDSYVREVFTLDRWRARPCQVYLYLGSCLLVSSLWQLSVGGDTVSVKAAIDTQTLMTLAWCNTFGAIIMMVGLHMRAPESAMWIEMSGYVSLIFAITTYAWLANWRHPTLSYEVAVPIALVLGMTHRCVQITVYKLRGRKRASPVVQLVRTHRKV